MAEEQIPIDTLSQQNFNAARESGATTTIEKSAVEDFTPPEVTGKESMKEFKKIREDQIERANPNRNVDRRIDRIVKQRETFRAEAETLRERLARYEAGQSESNNNGTEPQEQSQESESDSEHSGEERETSREEPKIAALRQRFPDWDRVMTRAKSEGMRISDQAAEVLHSVENSGHVAYLLASNDEFRNEFNKLPPARQAEEVRRINWHVAGIENGSKPFADKIRATLSSDELASLQESIQKNPAGDRLGTSLARELHDLSNGPQVFQKLINDPELCNKLANMSQSRAAMELGRISAGLEGRERIVSKASPPFKPVGGSSTATSSVPMDKMDQRSYNRARDAGRVR